MEELYASGFNAWGQLSFDNSTANDDNVDDISEFTCVLRGGSIAQVQAFLSHTSLKWNGVTRTAGYCPKEYATLRSLEPELCSTLVEASNGSVAVLDRCGAIHQHSSLRDLIGSKHHRRPSYPALPPCTQLIAYATGFAALTTNGAVYTWGDERYGACLGREASADSSPAEKPGLVTALQNLPTGPVAKIAAGGYMLAALTIGDDLYVWGGHPGKKPILADVTDEPAPVEVGDELDVADVAVGEAHLIVLSTNRTVYVVGDNGHGQLGSPLGSANSWRQVELELEQGKRAVGVAAGPRSSFIRVKTD